MNRFTSKTVLIFIIQLVLFNEKAKEKKLK